MSSYRVSPPAAAAHPTKQDGKAPAAGRAATSRPQNSRAPTSPAQNPRAQNPRAYVIAHRGRQVAVGAVTFWLTVTTVLAMAVWSAGTATYFVFRDDLLTRLMARQADMQYAYEDRIAALRTQVDRMSSRQLLDQEQVEQRIEQLAQRQSLLENRSTALAGLPEAITTGSVRPRPGGRAGRPVPFPTRPAQVDDTVIVTPSPDRHSNLESRVPALRAAHAGGADRQGPAARLALIEESLDRVDARHGETLLALEDHYTTRARRIRTVLADLGLDGKPLPPAAAPRGVGGPYIPVPAGTETGAFEKQLQRIDSARIAAERLGGLLRMVPVRRPIERHVQTSSGFGVRLDPFVRRPAMHSGLDFRAPTGERVLAAGAGTITTAGWSGGYGRMVEIDHGNGLTTRYAHLSEINVREGASVRPGQLIGLVGSTGRSTGPHLHYETRVDGEAVDPQRFLRAGLRLGNVL